MSCREVDHIHGIIPPSMLPHEDMVLCRREKAGGSVGVVMWCLRCQTLTGEISQGLVGGPAAIAALPLLDDLRNGFRTARQRQYDEYRQTQAWMSKRHPVIVRAHYCCEGCGQKLEDFEVHHLTYEHLFEEFLWELVALCPACHDRVGGYVIPDGA